MMKKKILFTIQWYPSNKSANVLCDDNIIKELINSGQYEVHCLVYKSYNQKEYEYINGLHVHRFERGIYFRLYTWCKSRENNSLARFVIKFDRLLLRIKQFMTIPIYPIIIPFLAFLFYRNAYSLNKSENFDLVISEHNGLDTLLAGYFLKRKCSSIKYIPILWDPIVGKEPAKYLPNRYAKNRLRWFEEKVLSKADKVIAMKSNELNLVSIISSKAYSKQIVFLDLPKIMPPKNVEMKSPYIKDGFVNIVYTGGLTPDRDPESIINIINNMGLKNVNLMFFASGYINPLRSYQKNFNGELLIHDYINHDEILSLNQRIDFFLNIGGPNSNMTPSKIFEYMSYGKPIISTYFIDNDSSKKYLDKYPLKHMIDLRDSNQNQLSNDLRAFVVKNYKKSVKYEEVYNLFQDNTPSRYIQVINEQLND